MFSKISSRIGKTAMTGLVIAGIGVGLLGGAGSASAQQNDGPGTGEGAAGECTYAGLKYSEGSKVKQADGNIYRCMADGTWVLGLTRPPTDKLPKFQTGGVLQRAQ